MSMRYYDRLQWNDVLTMGRNCPIKDSGKLWEKLFQKEQRYAGIRPFLSGLYYHSENFDFFLLSKQLSDDFTCEISYREVIS